MVEKKTIDSADEKVSKLKSATQLFTDIAQWASMAYSVTDIFGDGHAFFKDGKKTDSKADPRIIIHDIAKGGLLSPDDEALVQRLRHAIEAMQKKGWKLRLPISHSYAEIELEDNILEVFDIYRLWVLNLAGGSLGKVIASYELNRLRKYILTLVKPAQSLPYKLVRKNDKGKTVATREGQRIQREDFTQAINFLNRMAAAYNKGRTASKLKKESSLQEAGCIAVSEMLATESFPTPTLSQGMRKLQERIKEWHKNGGMIAGMNNATSSAKELRKSIRTRANKYREREAALPRWKRWLFY